MKILRDPKLIFWLILTFTLLTLTYYSLNSYKGPVNNNINIRVGSTQDYDSVTPAIDFMRRISGSYLAYNGGDFENWSKVTYDLARNNLNNFTINGGDVNSKTYQDWVQIVSVTKELSVTPYSNNDKIIQQTSLLNSITQNLITDVSIKNLNNNFTAMEAK